MEEQKKKFRELTFIRFTEPNAFRAIPRELFEQVKDYEFNLKRLLHFGSFVIQNPLTYLFVLTDVGQKIKGILWSRVDCIDELFEVYLLSVDPEYQDGDALNETLKFIRKVRDEERPKLKKIGIELKDKIVWLTTRPGAFKKIGAKRAKRIILEIDENDTDTVGSAPEPNESEQ